MYFAAKAITNDLASRLAHRIQLTTDGHRPYLVAVEDAFAGEVDYAMPHKLYEAVPEKEIRYSPTKCNGTDKKWIKGAPDPKKISTSYAERQNLTMRMGMRRFTRLINAFSRKIEREKGAVFISSV